MGMLKNSRDRAASGALPSNITRARAKDAGTGNAPSVREKQYRELVDRANQAMLHSDDAAWLEATRTLLKDLAGGKEAKDLENGGSTS